MAIFWEIAAHSVNQMFFFVILAVCNNNHFPFWFLGLDSGSDCLSS